MTYPHYSISKLALTAKGKHLRFNVRVWASADLYFDYDGCLASVTQAGERVVSPPRGFKGYTIVRWSPKIGEDIVVALENASGGDRFKRLEDGRTKSPWEDVTIEWWDGSKT